MTLAALTLLVMALAPTRWTRWAGWLNRPVMTALGPATGPLRTLANWARPPRAQALGDDERRALTLSAEQWQALWRKEQVEAARLRRLLDEMQRGRALNPNVDVVTIVAQVIAGAGDPASGVLQLRAGSDRGVQAGDAVVVDGVQLVGRVVDVKGLTSSALPITHRNTKYVHVVVDTGAADIGTLPIAQLTPGTGGELSGDVSRDATGVQVGQVVRLRDTDWPAAAQGLVVGKIMAIRPKETQPLRQVIEVRPEMDLRRLDDVLVYTSPQAPAPRAQNGGGQ